MISPLSAPGATNVGSKVVSDGVATATRRIDRE
jgi:hypothetical protein